MGIFKQRFEIAATPAGPYRTIEAMVDTGALCTCVPASVLRSLGVTPQRQRAFILANGTRIHHDMVEVAVRLGGRVRHTLCVFGDENTAPLSGAFTLEGFGLVVDPVNKRLVPMEVIPALTLLPAGGSLMPIARLP